MKPKRLTDFSTSISVLHFPGGNQETYELWKQSAEKLSSRSQKINSIELIETESHLAHDSDVYEQVFELPSEHASTLKLKITSFLAQDSLYEKCEIEGLDLKLFEAYLVHWHQPEIAASEILQSTAYSEKASWVCSWRGNTYFQVQAKSAGALAKVSFAECGWLQNHQAASERFEDVLSAILFSDTSVGYDSGSKDKKLPWLGLESRSSQALGKTDALIIWNLAEAEWELRYHYADSLDKIESSNWPSFEDNLASVKHIDKSWLSEQKSAPEYLPSQVKDLYQRTLLTLKQMQDPEGGIIAAPEFQFEFSHCGGYGFCWGRDAGFITLAMDICGMHKESKEFYRYMTRCQSSDGSFLHRHDMSGHLGSSWGFLQPDETGSVLFGLWKHLEITKDKALAEELRPMIDKACNWLIEAKHSWDSGLPVEGFDLWEEREGVHYYAVAAMSAGIRAAIDIYKLCDWNYPESWQQAFSSLKELANSDRFIQEDGPSLQIARTLHKKLGLQAKTKLEARGYKVDAHPSESGRYDYTLPADYVLDISQVGVAYPYDVLDRSKLGSHWNNYLKLVDERLWRGQSGGIGRYEGDYYREGNPWILATLWLALAAAQVDEVELAKKCWQWSLAHVSHEGLFAEQIDPESGQPAWVMPLTWSHAMFALAVHVLPEEVIL